MAGGCLMLTIKSDEYPEEVEWLLFDGTGTEILKSAKYPESENGFKHCFAGNTCWRFVLKDSYDNGICCEYGQGEYELYWEGERIYKGGEFGSYDHVRGCGANTGDCQVFVEDSNDKCSFPFEYEDNVYDDCMVDVDTDEAFCDVDGYLASCGKFTCNARRRLAKIPAAPTLPEAKCLSIRMTPDRRTRRDNYWILLNESQAVVSSAEFGLPVAIGKTITSLECFPMRTGSCFTLVFYDRTGDGILGKSKYTVELDRKVIIQSSMRGKKEESHRICAV